MVVQSFVDLPLLELMPDVVIIARRIGQDEYTTPQYGDDESYQARVEFKPHIVQSLEGQTLVASGKAILAVPIPVGLFDKITLPDGRSPTILEVQSSPDTVGRYWVEISF